MPTRKILDDPRFPKLAPPEFAGRWVAWNKDRTEIIAHGTTMAEVNDAIRALGQPDALMERVRRPDEIIVGRI